MNALKTRALVLNTRPYTEKMLVSSMFTFDRGKVDAASRGSRTLKSRFGSCLEPLSYIDAIFRTKQTGVWSIQQADLIRSFQELREDVIKLGYASVILETIIAYAPEEETDHALFHLVVDALANLAKEEAEAQTILAVYLARFSRHVGFLPEHPKSNAAFFNPAKGEWIEPGQTSDGALRIYFPHQCRTFIDQSLSLQPGKLWRLQSDNRHLKQLVDSLLQLLVFHFGVKLKSRKFIADISRNIIP